MERTYYKEYYHLERKNWWFIVRQRILQERISRLLDNPQGLEILNAGAATGSTSEMLSVFGNVMSLEYDEECCRFTKEILSTPLVQGSILELPFADGHFDLVCAFDVIEHVEDDARAVAEMYRVCKPGGYIAITVPAYMFLWGQHDVINQHYRRYTMKQLKMLVEKQRGNIVYETYFNSGLFIPIAGFRVLMRLIEKVNFKKRQKVSSDHEVFGTEGFFNKLLSGIFSIDRYLLKWGIRFPMGVSIMLFFKKDEEKVKTV
jgi:SAM-dependent methyltransferase